MDSNSLFGLIQHLFSLSLAQQVTVSLIPILLAFTFHEAAHGYAAKYFGDTSFDRDGVSLNPLHYIDLVGTVLVPLLTLLFGGVLFGWTRTMVDFSKLRNPRRAIAWVAAAGPASNLAMALLWGMEIKLCTFLPPISQSVEMFVLMGAVGVWVNMVFAVLNMLPIPALDGGRVALSLLPPRLAYSYSRLEPYGLIILLVLLISGIIKAVLLPIILFGVMLISLIFGL